MGACLLGALPAAAQPLAEPPAAVTDDPCSEGERLFSLQQYREAEAKLEQCLKGGDERPSALLLLTMITVHSGRGSAATAWGARALAAAPQSPDAHYWYGRALLGGGDGQGARQQWEAGLALDTNHVGLLEGLARLALDNREDAKAYNLLRQLQHQGVDSGWLHRLLSDLARRKGLWAEALRHWQDVMVREGEDEEALLTVGELGLLAGETASAIAACQRAVELSGSAAAHGGLGEALFAADRFEEALRSLRQAVALDPREPIFHFNLANVLEVLGHLEESEVHFARFVELDPDDAIGRFNIGILLDKLDRPQEALQQLQAAVRLEPGWIVARLVLGQLQERQGLYGDTLDTIDFLLTRDAENPEQLRAWRDRITASLEEVETAIREGKLKLLHIVASDAEAVLLIQEELADGTDFAMLATRFSLGPTAAQGGEIGWVSPADMVEPLRSAITALEPNEISDPIEARGLHHFFKRIR